MLFGSYMKVKNEGGVWKPEGLFRRWVLALVLHEKRVNIVDIWLHLGEDGLCHCLENSCLGKHGDLTQFWALGTVSKCHGFTTSLPICGSEAASSLTEAVEAPG